jgi:putative transposase
MPRQPRAAPGGYVYHALNRAVARLPLFQKEGDYAAFERVLLEALQEHPIRLLAYCVLPNHWHFVLWPEHEGQLTAFLRWLTHTHTQRWHAHYHTAGTGHLYQGRFKSFPIAEDEHLLTVLRYVERNALRAGLVTRAENWAWGSLLHWQRRQGKLWPLLHPGPVRRPRGWVEHVNRPETAAELRAVRDCVDRNRPYGPLAWQRGVAARLNLDSTLRPRGRPKKTPPAPAS